MTKASPVTADAYVPGVCNINTAEIAQRRKVGYVGATIFVVLLAVLVALPINRWVRMLLFLPSTVAASGFLQARNHFCVGYAAAGKQNAAEGSDSALEVIEQAAKAKDKQRARQMNLQAVGIGLVIALLTIAIPVFNK